MEGPAGHRGRAAEADRRAESHRRKAGRANERAAAAGQQASEAAQHAQSAADQASQIAQTAQTAAATSEKDAQHAEFSAAEAKTATAREGEKTSANVQTMMKSFSERIKNVGPFSFSGDIRLREEPSLAACGSVAGSKPDAVPFASQCKRKVERRILGGIHAGIG